MKTDELERQLKNIDRAREAMTKTMVRQFGADEALAQVVAADAVRQVLAPTRAQLIRAWARRHMKALLGLVVSPTLLALVIAVIVLLVSVVPPTYPRTYAVSDTWRPGIRRGFFADAKVDSADGRCFLSTDSDHSDCVGDGMLEEIKQALDEAAREGKQGKVWEGPNGRGEHWVIEHTGRRFTVTATREK